MPDLGKELWVSCKSGDDDEAQRLIDQGADVEWTSERGWWTPLIEAATRGRLDIIRLLLRNGADIHHKGKYGRTPLHWAAFRGKDEAVKLLIERGAGTHIKDNNGYIPLAHAIRKSHPSTADIIESAMLSTKVIYVTSSELQQSRVTFTDYSILSNIIILTDNDIPDGFEFEEHIMLEGHPTFTLRNVQQCIDRLLRLTTSSNEDDTIPPNNLHDIITERYPAIATRLQHWRMNLLHLIVYFPSQSLANDTPHETVISSLLNKCPLAATSVDIHRMTPLHHAAINLSRGKISQECHDVLLARSPPTVVHKAIEAGLDWEYLHPIVMAKLNALTVEDEESSGLLPFMLAAQRCNHNDDGDVGTLGLRSLSMVYELLCLKPEVLKDYDESYVSKRVFDGSKDSNDPEAKRSRKI